MLQDSKNNISNNSQRLLKTDITCLIKIIKLKLHQYKQITFFPGLTSLKATSAALFAAAMTSAALPEMVPSWITWVCAATAINPSM